MTKIYVFPGQGSQTVGMGKELFDLYPELVKQADQILGYSIKELCLEDAQKNLNITSFTQPALFIVNALTYLKKVAEAGSPPDFLAGHSLGEYDALFAAGCFDFATGVKLVQKRGALMAKVQGGGMAAVIGLTKEAIIEVIRQFPAIDVANFNSPTQTVISGPQADIVNAKGAFEAAGAKLYVVLKVSGAFHSKYMQEAQKEFALFLEQFQLSQPTIPVIANYSAKPYTAETIKENITQQISNSVRWVETIQSLKQLADPVFEEVGPGNVLTKLIGQIK